LSHFKAFYNDWLDCSGLINGTDVDHIVNLDPEFFTNLKFDNESLRQYRIDAAIKCSETLGDNPALCLSGGIDSQAMVQAWHEANLKFTTVIMVFKDGLNKQDSDHAKMFCEKNNYPYIELPFDIVNFLSRDNYSTSEKYKSISPHFNTHYRMAELLRNMGYTGVCCGGCTPYNDKGGYGYNFEKASFDFIRIQDILGIAFQGSFLSFYPELSWSIAFLTDPIDANTELNDTWEDYLFSNHERYLKKVKSYQRAGFEIIPQETKYTGFELVKKYFENLTGDGWTFERKFRVPIAAKFDKNPHVYKFNLSEKQLKAIQLSYLNAFGTN